MNAIADRSGAARANPASHARPPLHVLFLMTSAGVGGAEMLTISLLNRIDPRRFRLSLAYLKEEHELLDKIDQSHVNGHVFCCKVDHSMDWAAARRLGRFVREEGVDIVLCTNLYPLLYGWAARWMSGRRPKLVEVLHSIKMPSLKAKLQMLLYRPLLRLTPMLVYVCANQRRLWRKRYLAARQDTVIHNGIDIEHFSNRYRLDEIAALRRAHGLGPQDYVVGLCAYMRPEKAHGDLLEAAARAQAQGVPVKCLLIGDGPERAAIERKIAALGLASHAAITGLMPDVRPALAACDVLVIASRHETFSMAALESMAMAKPVVMTDVGGASEQVAHGISGYLYRSGDIDALTASLVRLADPGRRAAMGLQACRTVAARFSLEVMVDAYERLFLRLAQREHD